MIVLINGVNATESDWWGGIIDTDDLDPNIEDHKMVSLAIAEARNEKAHNLDYRCGSAFIENGHPDLSDLYKELPWSGTIEEEVVLITE